MTGAANTLQAWEDWHKLACAAVDAGMDVGTVNALGPNPQDGWRKVDAAIARLREKMDTRG